MGNLASLGVLASALSGLGTSTAQAADTAPCPPFSKKSQENGCRVLVKTGSGQTAPTGMGLGSRLTAKVVKNGSPVPGV